MFSFAMDRRTPKNDLSTPGLFSLAFFKDQTHVGNATPTIRARTLDTPKERTILCVCV